MASDVHSRIVAYLANHQVGILSTAGPAGAWALPVRYQSQGLKIGCVVPRWADTASHLEDDPRVVLAIPSTASPDQYWLLASGVAWTVPPSEWRDLVPAVAAPLLPDDLYVVVQIRPTRIDLVDERQGWGRRENLDICAASTVAIRSAAPAPE